MCLVTPSVIIIDERGGKTPSLFFLIRSPSYELITYMELGQWNELLGFVEGKCWKGRKKKVDAYIVPTTPRKKKEDMYLFKYF